jgi:hypothetical protein
MFGCFPPAFAGSGKVKVGLDRTRADGSGRRLDNIAEQPLVLGEVTTTSRPWKPETTLSRPAAIPNRRCQRRNTACRCGHKVPASALRRTMQRRPVRSRARGLLKGAAVQGRIKRRNEDWRCFASEMGDIIAQLKQGRPHMAWLTAGLHFADKHVRAVGYIDVREDVDAVIGSGTARL